MCLEPSAGEAERGGFMGLGGRPPYPNHKAPGPRERSYLKTQGGMIPKDELWSKYTHVHSYNPPPHIYEHIHNEIKSAIV